MVNQTRRGLIAYLCFANSNSDLSFLAFFFFSQGGEGGDDSGDRPASVADQADDQSSQGTPESAAGGADAAASTEEKLGVTDQHVQSQTASGVGSPTADRSSLTNETASLGNVTAGPVTDSAAENVASVDNDQTGQTESLAKDE